MLWLGVILGIVTAWGHSLAYLASRWFTVGKRGTSKQLLVVAHLQLGLLASAGIGLAWPSGLTFDWSWGVPALIGVACFCGAQSCLFGSLRHADASVVAPLLSVKIAVLAGVTTLGLYGESRHVSALGWLAVLFAIAGAALTQGVGQRPPTKALVWLGVAIVCYAFCDLSIVQSIRNVEAQLDGNIHPFRAGAFIATVLYTLTGVIALGFAPWFGSRRTQVWLGAVPYTAMWTVAMVGLYGTFAILGVVYGAILQSTRALWSVLLGGVIGKLGDGDLETDHHPSVLGWRVAAAVMLITAVGLFSYVSAPAS